MKVQTIRLDQRLVTRYAKYNALKNWLEGWLKKRREAIVGALRGGQKCPERGPYLLELGDAEARIDWKEEFRRWMWANGKTKEQVGNIIEQIEGKKRPKELRLHCKVNPGYRGVVELELPR